MTERRYGFRFSAVEAGLLVMSVVLASVFVFIAGVYVGKGVEAHRTAQLTPTVQLPVQIPEEPRPSATDTPLTWKLPKDKPVGVVSPVAPVTGGDSAHMPSPSTQTSGASTSVSATKKAPATEVLSGEKIVEQQQLPSAKKASPVKDLPQTSALATQTDKPEEPASSARTAAVQSLDENLTDTKETPSPTQKVARPAKGWKVQVEATSREETAQEIAKALRAQGYEPSVSKVTKQGEALYRVRVGRFTTQEEAVAAITRFRREGKFSQAYPVSE